ncbi:hypothetical protein BD410DRAFT_808077 [Rickenella mellea]|uniref:Uncharacterized protein n=1 Tax=Rickenella mellea TaxID=50990 RepID=A0A4Y7PPG5_9AGAM|nr:hypothetical protein BD410DRAFT_808077 [Rickenella mellea]
MQISFVIVFALLLQLGLASPINVVTENQPDFADSDLGSTSPTTITPDNEPSITAPDKINLRMLTRRVANLQTGGRCTVVIALNSSCAVARRTGFKWLELVTQNEFGPE